MGRQETRNQQGVQKFVKPRPTPGKRKSPFIGQTESSDAPILYQRYTDLSDMLLEADVDGTADQISGGTEHDKVAAEDAKVPQPSTKKAKKEKKQKKAMVVDNTESSGKQTLQEIPSTSGKGIENAEPQEDAKPQEAGQGGDEDQQPKKKKKKKDKSKKLANPSGPGNADEAVQIRSIMGFANSAAAQPSQQSGFSFGFSGSENVEDKQQATEPNASVNETQTEKDSVKPKAKKQKKEVKTAKEEDSEQSLPAESEPSSTAQPTVGEDVQDPKVRKVMGLPPLCVPRRIFAGGMPFSYDEDEVRDYWSYCGELEEVDLMRFPDTGRFKGIAFITFSDESGYQAALQCNGEYIGERQLKVEKCFSAGQKDDRKQKQQKSDANAAPKVAGYNVAHVCNVAFEASHEHMKELFEGCKIAYVRVHTDKDTGRPKGFAHVHFEDEASLDKALEYNGAELMGRRIKVSYAQPKKS